MGWALVWNKASNLLGLGLTERKQCTAAAHVEKFDRDDDDDNDNDGGGGGGCVIIEDIQKSSKGGGDASV